MKTRSITVRIIVSVYIIASTCSARLLPGPHDQNLPSQDLQLSNQEPIYSSDSPERLLACNSSAFVFPTLPGDQYLQYGTGPQTITWNFPAYDTSAGCLAPPPLIGWWLTFTDSDGVYQSYDDFPYGADYYMSSCRNLSDYTTCTSVVLSNVPWLTGTDRSLTIDTNSTSIRLNYKYSFYVQYRYLYDFPYLTLHSTIWESLSFTISMCETTNFYTNRAVTGSQIIYARGSGLMTLQLDQIQSVNPDCGYTWMYHLECVSSVCDLTSDYYVTLTDTVTGNFTIDQPINTGRVITVAAQWYVSTPDNVGHPQINHTFDFVFYTAITSTTWGTYPATEVGYIGFQTFDYDWPTLSLMPSIVDTVYNRTNFNMKVNNWQLYSNYVRNNYAGSWLGIDRSTQTFKYILDRVDVSRDGEVNVLLFDWTITDEFGFSETKSFTQTVTFVCAMYSVTRENTWTQDEIAITIFNPKPYERLLEVYTEFPACGNSYTVTLTYSQDNWATVTTVTTEAWITTDHFSRLSIASSDKNLHDVKYDIRMTAAFDRAYSSNPEASFSVKFTDPCFSLLMEAQSLPAIFLFVDQTGKGHTVYTQLLPALDEKVNQLYGDPSSSSPVCGPQNIDVSDRSGLIESICSIDGQTLKVYTSDVSLAGEYTVDFDFQMTDYPTVTAQLQADVHIYSIVEPNSDLDPVLFDIMSTGRFSFTVLLHTIKPQDGLTTLSYSLLNEDESPAPSWVSLQQQTSKVEVQVQSSDPTDVGEYNIILRATARHSLSSAFSYVDLPFQVTMIAPIGGTVVNLAPNWLGEIPESFTIQFGEAFEYILPGYEDYEGDEVVLTVNLGPSKIFLTFTEELGAFSIPTDATKESDAGAYTIKLSLEDSAGSQTATTFVLNIEGLVQEVANQDDTNEEETSEEEESSNSGVAEVYASRIFMSKLPATDGWDWAAQFAKISQKNYKPLPPEVKLVEITKTGLVTIAFTKDMVVPPLHVLQSVRVLQEEDGDDSGQLAVVARVIPGELSDPSTLEMRYNITSYTTKQLQLQLQFDQPLFVSAQSDRDLLQVFFPNRFLFFDTDGLFIKANIFLTRVLPSQMDPASIEAQLAEQGETIATGSTALMAGNFILNFFLSAGMNQMLSLIETQQILLVSPLFMLTLPANAAIFFKFVMEIAAFDLLPMEILYEDVFGWEDTTDAINTNFEDEGFDSSLFLFNVGSILILCLVWLPLLLTHVCCSCFTRIFCCGRQDKCFPDRRYKLRNLVFWTHPVMTLYESFFVICLCTFINLKHVTQNSPQERVSYTLTVIFLGICVGYPIVLLTYLCYNYDRLRLRRYKRRCGAIFEKLDLIKGRQVLIGPFWFLLRRFILAYICVNPPGHTLVFQFMIMQWTIYTQVVIGGFIEPLKLKNERRTELINEVIITFSFYTFLCFSDLVPDLQVRALVGSLSCLIVVLHFLANVGVIVYLTLSQCREKARKRRLKLKRKRLIADGVLQSKKQIRETKRKAIVEQNLLKLQKLEEIKELPIPEMTLSERQKLMAKAEKISQQRTKAIQQELEACKLVFVEKIGQFFDEAKQINFTNRSSVNDDMGADIGVRQFEHDGKLKIPEDYFAHDRSRQLLVSFDSSQQSLRLNESGIEHEEKDRAALEKFFDVSLDN